MSHVIRSRSREPSQSTVRMEEVQVVQALALQVMPLKMPTVAMVEDKVAMEGTWLADEILEWILWAP